MTARVLRGRPIADVIQARSLERSVALQARHVTPRLAIVSVGIDPAASAYASHLRRSGASIGAVIEEIVLARGTTEETLAETLESLGRDPNVHGVLLLTPLPSPLDEAHIVDHIAIAKDVEGMNPFSMGLLADGRPQFIPSTAEAIVEMLKFYAVPLHGAHIVILGRSTVIGRPVASLLLEEDATVTIAHSRTVNVGELTRAADIVVIGVGRAGLVTGAMLRPGAIVIDAGINVTPDGIVGEADAESVSAVAGAFSPVPGGLGAVTTALLLRNLLTATERQLG